MVLTYHGCDNEILLFLKKDLKYSKTVNQSLTVMYSAEDDCGKRVL